MFHLHVHVLKQYFLPASFQKLVFWQQPGGKYGPSTTSQIIRGVTSLSSGISKFIINIQHRSFCCDTVVTLTHVTYTQQFQLLRNLNTNVQQSSAFKEMRHNKERERYAYSAFKNRFSYYYSTVSFYITTISTGVCYLQVSRHQPKAI